MSLTVKNFITDLRARMRVKRVSDEDQELLVDEILIEYEAMPGPIHTIAWAVLVHSGYYGLANDVASKAFPPAPSP